jgi:hypothetical protein
MTTDRTVFFANDDNKSAIKKFLGSLPDTHAKSAFETQVGEHLKRLLTIIINNAEKFDENCQVNIKWIGQYFMTGIMNSPGPESGKSLQVPAVFSAAYRFLCEFEFAIDSEISMELRQIKSFVTENLLSFSESEKRDLVFAHYIMPASIAKSLLQHSQLKDAHALSANLAAAETLRKTWDDEIAARTTEVNALKQQLDSAAASYNFVGLVDGFRRLVTQKNNEKRVAFITLVVIGLVIIVPLVLELVFVARNISLIEEFKGALLYALPALFALEILLVYFFRVVLTHFRSIKAQLLQLELRTALCQFIQGYSAYASKIKEKDASALEKFESLIFSGLIADEGKLPSTFDGTEQLAKLIGSLRDGR